MGGNAKSDRGKKKTGTPGEASAGRKAKDSVFCDLFSDKRYLKQLYSELHPEDVEVEEGDLKLVSLDRVLTRGQYNDLGFTVGDKLVVLVEAQSTWTPNIVVRMLLYLADTYKRQIAESKHSIYDAQPVALPAPDLYVVYTGTRRNPPTRDILLARHRA